jgi:hypothetical protein
LSDVTTTTSENLTEFHAANIPGFNKPTEKVVEKLEGEAKPEGEEEGEEKPAKRKKGLSDRMSELTTRAKEAKEEAARERKSRETLEARLAELEGKKPEKEEKKAKPNRADFTDAFDYAEELGKWNREEAKREFEEKAAADKHQEKQATVLKDWQKRVTEARGRIEDFDDMVQSSQLAVSDLVRDTIIESDIGADLLYHFASDDEEAEKINAMTQKQALMYLAKLEVKLEAKIASEKEDGKEEKVADPEEKPKRVKLPEPLTPIRASNPSGVKESAAGEWTGTFEEYKAARKAGKI